MVENLEENIKVFLKGPPEVTVMNNITIGTEILQATNMNLGCRINKILNFKHLTHIDSNNPSIVVMERNG